MEMVDEPTSFYTKVSEMHRGAEWFFWVAALSVINSLVVTFGSMGDTLFGLGGTRVIDQYMRAGSLGAVEAWWLPLSLLLPLVFAGIGYLAWRGSDKAFIIGMFLYASDAMIVIGFAISLRSASTSSLSSLYSRDFLPAEGDMTRRSRSCRDL
ncbi:MAG: hypothetical protein H0V76_09585 [Blastocatellia bacterium]|nr:hypothetical protein [Blastocatellia bacterium]